MNVAGAQLADPFEKDLLKAQASYPNLKGLNEVEREAKELISKVSGWTQATGLSDVHRQQGVIPEHCNYVVIAQVRKNPAITRPMCLCDRGPMAYNGARTNAEALLQGYWRILDKDETLAWYAKTAQESRDAEARRVQAVAVSTGAAAMKEAATVLSEAAKSFQGDASRRSVRTEK